MPFVIDGSEKLEIADGESVKPNVMILFNAG
jgi:hypothetical protein